MDSTVTKKISNGYEQLYVIKSNNLEYYLFLVWYENWTAGLNFSGFFPLAAIDVFESHGYLEM